MGALALLVALDTAAWLVATRRLRAGIEDWASRERRAGVNVDPGEMSATGWPFAAAQRLSAARFRVAGAEATVALVAALSPTHPDTLRLDLDQVRLTAPGLPDLAARAEAWRVDVNLGAPNRADVAASALALSWQVREAAIGRLAGAVVSPGLGLGVDLQADDVELARSGLALPASPGSRLSSVRLVGLAFGAPPPADASALAAARAWRDAGGYIDLSRFSIQYGPLDASLGGRLGLDSALRPTGELVLTARGVIPLLDALAASGTIAPREAQAARGVLMLLGAAAGDGDITAPVTAADGRLSVGGFPVARLPPLPFDAEVSR